MVSAVKVQFLKEIFEEDFVEKGMTAWLTDIRWEESLGTYNLFFDFSEFEEENLKYFKASYYVNSITKQKNLNKPLYTAIEAGYYTSKYSVYFDIPGEDRDDNLFTIEIQKYLKELDI
jgi:hypothetical protein